MTTMKSDAERAAEATRKVIARFTKKHKRNSLRILGEAGPRNSLYFDDEFAEPDPIIFDKKSEEWRKPGRWAER